MTLSLGYPRSLIGRSPIRHIDNIVRKTANLERKTER